MLIRLIRGLKFLLLLVGLDLSRFAKSFFLFPRYLREWSLFKAGTDWNVRFYPCLYDASEQSGSLGEYFWQDLYVATKIIQAPRGRHIDVGSRVDGFVAHLATCLPVEIFDIRPLAASIPNVRYQQWDMTIAPDIELREIADSLSCLHTIEHVGLGRYGDPIDPNGWRGALINLAALLKPGGHFWLSVPVGIERVEFNAHRVFSPFTIDGLLNEVGFGLVEFVIVDDHGAHLTHDVYAEMSRLSKKSYALGIFCYRKHEGL